MPTPPIDKINPDDFIDDDDLAGFEGLEDLTKPNTDYKTEDTPDNDSTNKETIEQRMQRLELERENDRALSNIVSDLDVREILKLKQEGKKFKVVVEGENEPDNSEKIDLDSVDLESLSDKDKIVVLRKMVSQDLLKQLDEKYAPLVQAVGGIVKSQEQQQEDALRAEIADCQKRYKDFDLFREDMAKLSPQAPGLGVEELYLLSKYRRRQSVPVKERVSSERPDRRTISEEQQHEDGPETEYGANGFKNMIAQALTKKK